MNCLLASILLQDWSGEPRQIRKVETLAETRSATARCVPLATRQAKYSKNNTIRRIESLSTRQIPIDANASTVY